MDFFTKLDGTLEDNVVKRQKRSRRNFVPDSEKNEDYWTKRTKNNESAHNSRNRKKMYGQVMEEYLANLQVQNKCLRARYNDLAEEYIDIRNRLKLTNSPCHTTAGVIHEEKKNKLKFMNKPCHTTAGVVHEEKRNKLKFMNKPCHATAAVNDEDEVMHLIVPSPNRMDIHYVATVESNPTMPSSNRMDRHGATTSLCIPKVVNKIPMPSTYSFLNIPTTQQMHDSYIWENKNDGFRYAAESSEAYFNECLRKEQSFRRKSSQASNVRHKKAGGNLIYTCNVPVVSHSVNTPGNSMDLSEYFRGQRTQQIVRKSSGMSDSGPIAQSRAFPAYSASAGMDRSLPIDSRYNETQSGYLKDPTGYSSEKGIYRLSPKDRRIFSPGEISDTYDQSQSQSPCYTDRDTEEKSQEKFYSSFEKSDNSKLYRPYWYSLEESTNARQNLSPCNSEESASIDRFSSSDCSNNSTNSTTKGKFQLEINNKSKRTKSDQCLNDSNGEIISTISNAACAIEVSGETKRHIETQNLDKLDDDTRQKTNDLLTDQESGYRSVSSSPDTAIVTTSIKLPWKARMKRKSPLSDF